MINSVVLVGRIANDPEMKYTPSGMPITNFRIGVQRVRKSESGEEQTDWFNVVCFQKTAEFVAQYLDKGSLIGVEGRLQSRNFEDASGKRQTWTEIVANSVQRLESRAESERRREQRGQAGPGGQGAPPAQGGYGNRPPAYNNASGGAAYSTPPQQPQQAPPDDYGPVGIQDDPFGDQ